MAATYNLYSVKDRKGFFMDPIPLISDANAIRSFRDVLLQVKSSDSGTFSVPFTDLELYRIGTFDLSSGNIEPEVPVFIADFNIVGDIDEK